MALLSRDDTIVARVIDSFIPACFENITKNTVLYNKALLDLFGLPTSEVLIQAEWINAKNIVDKDIINSEVFKLSIYGNCQLQVSLVTAQIVDCYVFSTLLTIQ